jgi:hypothetical protein
MTEIEHIAEKFFPVSMTAFTTPEQLATVTVVQASQYS